MRRSIISLLVGVLVVSILGAPTQTVSAQGIALPAEMNKTFTPIAISAGGTSLVRITIFNPNAFQLTNASWTDNMPAAIDVVEQVSNSCGGFISAVPGSSSIALSGGIVPAQSEATPGSCTVTIRVTSSSRGNWINNIRAGTLTATGPGGINITTTSDANATLNVDGSGEPSVRKSFDPTTIWAGGTSQLTIHVTNNAAVTLTGVSLTDDLPTNVFFANPAAPALSTGCGGSASVSLAGNSLTLNNGTIPPGAICTITVNVTGDVQEEYTNTIPAQSLDTDQNLTNPAAAEADLTVREIGMSKRFSSTTIEDNEVVTLTITLQNPRSTPYTGVDLTDNLPTPLIVAGTPTSNCGVPPGTLSATSTSVSLANGTIPAGSPSNPGACTISIPVTIPPGAASGRAVNRIPTTGLTTDQGIRPLNPATATIIIAGSAPVLTKSFSSSPISAGETSRLRITITAPGDTDLTNLSVRDNLPAGVTIANAPPAPEPFTSCPGGRLTADDGTNFILLENGSLAAGQNCRIDVYVTGSLPGSYVNTILPGNVTNDQNRQPSGNITATLRITQSSTLGISLVKGFDPPGVFLGASSLMSIELINPGNVTLTGITFTDEMPMENNVPGTGMVLANPPDFNVGTCGGTLTGAAGENSFTFSGGSLPPLGRCILTLRATMTVNGNRTNIIPAQAVETDQQITNAEPTQASLTNLPGASVSKRFSPNPISAGSYSMLTITIQNTGVIELLGMGLSDMLPAGLVIAGSSTPSPVNNCGGTFVAIPGTQLIELTNGSLAGNSSCTMVVAVTGSNPGDYINTIPAGALITDPSVGATNSSPAMDTLTITDNSTSGGGGGNNRGGGRGRNNNAPAGATTAGAFLIPVTGFAPGRTTQLDTSSRPIYDATSLEIEIPVIKVDTSIVGVESKNGNWDVAWLQGQVGWLNGTAYPTWKGNSVLTAHVVNADGKPGVFSRLKALGVGEYIYVYSAGYRYTYKVVSNTVVQPDDITVMKHEEKSYLTLITCASYDEKTGTYLQRVAVRAVLVDIREDR